MTFKIVPVEPTKRLIIDLKDIMEPWGLSKEQVVACYKEFIRCAAGIGNCQNSASPPAPSVEDIKELLKSLQGAWCVKNAVRDKATELLAQFEENDDG